MSRMLGFRLDPDNPREAQALAVLERGQEAGYSIRHIVTEALLSLEAAAEGDRGMGEMLQEMAEALRGMEELLRQLQSGHVNAALAESEQRQSNVVLTDAFLLSVKRASKAGVKLE